jgi:hypothetical protein
MLRSVSTGIDVCVTVTLVDGLVLARSAFHHSINYRSVVVLGAASVVDEPAEKREAHARADGTHHPGRWNDVRWPTDQELRATIVLSLPISEVSAKVRRGPPKDDEEDYDLPIWAGELPLRLAFGVPIPDDRLKSAVEVPCIRQQLQTWREGRTMTREERAALIKKYSEGYDEGGAKS